MKHTRLASCVWLTAMGSLACETRPLQSSDVEAPQIEVEALAIRTSTAPTLVRRSYKAMGTQITITALARDEALALGVLKDAFIEFDRLERMMTVWRKTSDIARLNAAAGKKPVQVSPETMNVLLAARRFSEASGGKFDVTFGALSGLWKFDHDKDDKLPDKAAVAARTALIDYQRLVLRPKKGTAFLKTKGMRVHVGGIAKGYAVDRAVKILKQRGLQNFMVQAGGDLYVSGSKGKRPWRVGIRDPRGGTTSYFAAAEVTDATFSTSGDYERFFIKDNKRYHHIIDPDTGQPARGCRSVTIMAKSAMTADALSTAVFLLGPEKGIPLVEATAGAGAVIVDANNKVHITKRLEGKVKILHRPSSGL